MDRSIVWTGAQSRSVDMLFAQRAAMIGLAKVIEAVVGTGTFAVGLACTPSTPAALTVQVGPGQLYSLQNVDSTAYSSLTADTTHQIMKQGLLMDAVTLSCPAPGTAGQSINYLVQATFQEVDAGSTILSYYNSANPTQPYSGPNGAGTSNYTTRLDQCSVAVKAGTAATTGTQTTPAPDAGYVGLWVITVANGQTAITSPNITEYASAPFLPYTLASISPGYSNVQVYSTAGTYTFTVPQGVTKLFVEGWGGGGGGSGNAANTVGSCGGSGAYGAKLCSVTPGQQITVTVAAAAAGGAAGGNSGANGGSCSFGSLLTIAGGGGGPTGSGAGSAGGVAPSGVDIAIAGVASPGSSGSASNAYGQGGSAPRGGPGGPISSTGGVAGGWPGGGGGAGVNPSTAEPGGAGAVGGFVVRW